MLQYVPARLPTNREISSLEPEKSDNDNIGVISQIPA